MAQINVPGLSAEVFDANIVAFRDIVRRYHADPAFRAEIESRPVETFRSHGIELPTSLDVNVTANTPDTLYVVFPPDPNIELVDENLETIAGGSSVGSAGSVATASSVVCACVPSSASSVSSAGTASSVDV